MIAALRFLSLLLACGFVQPALAAFTDNGDGTVTDTVTGLMWDKCSWGQGNIADCSSGAATEHTWGAALGLAVSANAANHRGHGDWRLPNRSELESLLDLTAFNPALNTAAFPGSASLNYYWSSTSSVPNLVILTPIEAWFVAFTHGYTGTTAKADIMYVRLVRDGPLTSTFDALDTTPNAFVFTDQNGVARSTSFTSNNITVAGINTAAPISVSGGEYRINGGAWTSVAGTVSNGDTVAVRHTSSGAYSTTVNTVLGIGGMADTFSTTTLVAPFVNAACGSLAATSFKPAAGLCVSGDLNAAGVVRNGSNWSWACDGSGGGSSTAANACSAPLAPSATGSGTVAVDVSGAGWAFAPIGAGIGQMAGCIATSGHAKSPPSLPPGVSFPHGLCDVVLSGGAVGGAATVTLSFPTALPAGAVWWKYGRTAANPVSHWYQYPGAVIAGNTVTLSLVDGGNGDDDLTANGTIVDPGGPGVGGVADIPTLSEWGLLLLSGLMLLGWRGRRSGLGNDMT